MKSKILFGLSLLPLALSSCGNKNADAVYAFQMGKRTGAHVTTSMTLTQENYIDSDTGTVVGKKMSLFGQLQAGPRTSSESAASATAASSEESNPLSNLMKTLAEGVTVPGYYNIGADRPEGRKRLKLWYNLSTLIEDLPTPITLEPEIIELFIFSEIDDKKIYLQIPVSFKDLYYQLYWYGYDMPFIAALDNLDLLSLIEDITGDSSAPQASAKRFLSGTEKAETSSAPASSSEPSSSGESSSSSSSSSEPVIPKHEPGTKPTKAEVEEINKTFPAAHDGEKYRCWYTVSLPLTRQ